VNPNAALYVRVSTSDQHLDNQLPELRQLAEARGFTIVETYSESVSAAAKTRPAFEKLLRDAHRGKFSVVVVWSLDRFGRSMLGNLTSVLDLDRRGVTVLSVREPWLDLGGSHVRTLLLGIMSWVAEQERLRLGERVRAGIDRARRQGVRLGRPRADVDLDRALALREGGASIRSIAKTLGCSASVVHRAVSSRTRTPSE